MARTFEEVAGRELDALYQGALFLTGGNRQGAETLLVEAVTLAFTEHAGAGAIADVERWFEARLVRSFLRHARQAPTELPAATAERLALDPMTFESLESDQLFDAAATIPVWPRAALWLVLLRRWSYGGAADVMGVDRETVQQLLGHRDTLLRQLIGASRGGRFGAGTA